MPSNMRRDSAALFLATTLLAIAAIVPTLAARDVPLLRVQPLRTLLSIGGFITNPNFTDTPLKTGWTIKGQYAVGTLSPTASSVEQRWPQASGYVGFGTASTTSNTTASQAVPNLVIGQAYTLSFYLETPCLTRYSYVCNNTAMLVSLNAATLWSSRSAVLSTSWTKYSTTFTATSTTQTLTFTTYHDSAVTNGQGAAWGWYYWLTDVTLIATAAVTNPNFTSSGAGWTIAGQYDTGALSPTAGSVEQLWPETSGYLGFGTAWDAASATTASQAVSDLVIGQAYTLSFYLETPCLTRYSNTCNNTAMLVTLDTAALWSSRSAVLSTSWTKYSTAFTATSTTQTLTFTTYYDASVANGQGAAWGWYYWLTDVSLATPSV